jgi:hypothetical protein
VKNSGNNKNTKNKEQALKKPSHHFPECTTGLTKKKKANENKNKNTEQK